MTDDYFNVFQNEFFKVTDVHDYEKPLHEYPETESEETANQQNPTSVDDLLESEDWNTSKAYKTNLKPIDVLIMIFKYCFHNTCTYKAFIDLIKIVNVILNAQILPESIKFYNKIFDNNVTKDFHAVCPFCNKYYLGKIDTMKKKKIRCKRCRVLVDVSRACFRNFFIIIDPSKEIQRLIESNQKYYSDIMYRKTYSSGVIKDITDGKMYRKFVQSLPESQRNSFVSFIFNSDGAQVFERSKNSLYPIYLMLNEIPPSVRTRNLIVCGLWFGPGKPNMSLYMKCFADYTTKKLTKTGINCKVNGIDTNLKCYLLLCCVDTICRPLCQGIKQFNGKWGCSWCLHTGKMLGTMRYYPNLKRQMPKDRDHKSTIAHMHELVSKIRKIRRNKLLKKSKD